MNSRRPLPESHPTRCEAQHSGFASERRSDRTERMPTERWVEWSAVRDDENANEVKQEPAASGANEFYEQVYAVVERIPYGKVVSYGQIALMCGKPRGAREVGRAMYRCPDHLPWQRVVMADGSVAGGDHANIRKAILESEGVAFLPDGRVDMQQCGIRELPDRNC